MPWLLAVLAVLVLSAGIYFGGVGGITAVLLVVVFIAAVVIVQYLPPSRRARPGGRM